MHCVRGDTNTQSFLTNKNNLLLKYFFTMQIISTLSYAMPLTNGTVLAAAYEVGAPQPLVTDSGTVENLPEPQINTLYLVDARVFELTERSDFVMFAHTLTQRNTIIAQGGYVTRNGDIVPF